MSEHLVNSEHCFDISTSTTTTPPEGYECASTTLQHRLHVRLSLVAHHIDHLLTQRHPWLNWVFVYGVGLLYFFSVRCVTMPSLLATFGAKKDDKFSVKLAGIALGFLEDTIWLNYLVLLLWLVDFCFAKCSKDSRVNNGLLDCFATGLSSRARALLIMKRFARFSLFLALFLIIVAAVAADSVLMRTRTMRFTFEFVKMYFNDKSAASSLEVSSEDLQLAYQVVGATASVAFLFALIATAWIDLTLWNPSHLFAAKPSAEKTLEDSPLYVMMEQGGEHEAPTTIDTTHKDSIATLPDCKSTLSTQAKVKTSLVVLCALVAMPIIGLAIAHSSSAVVAHVALNTSLNEPFRIWFHDEFLPGLSSGSLASMSSPGSNNLYIHSNTESYSAFDESVLYRRTTGFKGDLAFDVQVDQEDLPNVIVIVVESFRYHDSQYLVGDDSRYLLKNTNMTVTPNFDRWAKRGIAFRNLWSSWRTSRSLESILFGQPPYDSLTDSGTTGGRKNVELSGMPQLFKAKGYEPIFTTGCRTDYDQWDKFLPTHGFEQVLSMNEVKALAEKDLGIDPKDWAVPAKGGRGRAMSYWGVHDDISFEVLGNILTNKTDAQKACLKNNEPKKPFFINHYTISSHTPFKDRPSWFDSSKTPDLRALYEDEDYATAVKNYLEMRYFTDLALGKFMDRMEKQGVLNDTIVLIVGDHGQAPEHGLDVPETRQVSATRVAATLIAEGRLGKYAGMMFDDAAEQCDLLNTLADIVGVPEQGFIQSGVGRSLKREIPFGQRVVWSNNPSQKMAAIRGHKRLQYDRLSSDMALFDADRDHEQQHDLFPALSDAQKQEMAHLRDAGRRLNMYFKQRWDDKCILKVEC